jgi:7,8-dihydropterin-6-yl-methyl-4-(beta-D-ribofuranosyl)aminobenzene 5'-phosphate synthase
MSKIQGFGETENVEVTILVDNRADLILESTDTVVRFKDKALLAEHGFAALIDLKDARTKVLWDAGVTNIALLENTRRMEIDLGAIDVIALSHGHGDHTAALTDTIKAMGRRPGPRNWAKDAPLEEILEWVKGRPVPVIVHPAAFRERWRIKQDGSKFGPGLPASRAEWEAAGAEIVLSDSPYELSSGCWTTGAVPRLSFEEAGTSQKMAFREGDVFIRDKVDDDQAIVINVKNKGLVIVAGCAHSGIINTVNYAQELSGVKDVWAILGGFHLAPAGEEEIQRTIDDIKSKGPAIIAPTHCSGFAAISQFAAQMPDAFVLGAVGTRFVF